MENQYMRLNKFIELYGIPRVRMDMALHGEYANQVGKKIFPEKRNSPYLINVEKTLKLFKEGLI